MIYDIFLMAFYNLSHRRTRTALTVLGIVIGISAIVALTSVAAGLKIYIQEQLSQLGADTLTIVPGSSSSGGFGPPIFSKGLSQKDVDTANDVRGVKIASGFLVLNSAAEYRKEQQGVVVNGMEAKDLEEVFGELQSFQAQFGRQLKKGDRFEAVIGYNVANDLFEDKLRVGDKLKVSGQEFAVVGILKRIGNQVDDNSVLIPIQAARDLFNEPQKVMTIFIKLDEGADANFVADEIKDRLEDKRGIKDFQVFTAESLTSTIGSVISSVEVVIVGIALISLIVGGIGIMNTMFMSILERTKEIGIMKSVGATNNVILSMFLAESAMLGVIGGVIGLAVGSAAAFLFTSISESFSFTLRAAVTPGIIAGSLAFSVVVGVIAGFVPARRASNMQPVDALRYE